ncbi:MAG: hypothetical protein VB027_04695 [Gordonibacter sp.]|nr:hypothetical protein [Gordonibacter sp.]
MLYEPRVSGRLFCPRPREAAAVEGVTGRLVLLEVRGDAPALPADDFARGVTLG